MNIAHYEISSPTELALEIGGVCLESRYARAEFGRASSEFHGVDSRSGQRSDGCPGELSYAVTGADDVVVDTLLEGEFELEHREGTHLYGRRDVFIANQPGADFASRIRDIRVLTTTLLSWLVENVANLDPEGEPEPVRFTSREPRAGDSRHWRNMSRLVEELVGGAGSDPGSLIVGALARQLASAVLVTFANDSVAEPTWRDQHDRHPASCAGRSCSLMRTLILTPRFRTSHARREPRRWP